ncbi:MAG: hypothetical protein BGO31_09450 [Bacteroidetes bacterium 43-16]|nr:MAG: hypothetical protein BGO31_09450 [Bacteroidetes bacterium 43-16]
MEDNRFDLIDILVLLKSKFKTLLIITVLGIIASVIFVMIRTDVYTAEANVIVKSYMNFDRNQMFSEEAFYIKDAFAKENEIDKAMTILGNSDVISFINQETKYQEVKKIREKDLFDAIKANYTVKRTDNSDLEIKFTDQDPDLALKALQSALYKAEDLYVSYFEEYNKDITKEIDFKRQLLADSLQAIGTQIAAVRKAYNIYNALGPVRGTAGNSGASPVTESNTEGIEQLKSLVQIKDKLDEENAKLASLKSQYNSFLNENKMRIFYKVSGPYKPTIPSNPKAIFIVLGSAVAAFLFSCFWVLLTNAMNKRTKAQS